MGPGASGQTIIAGQSVGEHAQVGSTLNVVVPPEDVGATASNAHVAQCQLENAVGPGVVVTIGVLGTTHAPNNGTRAVVDQSAGHTLELSARSAGYTLDFFRIPAFYFLTNLIHAPHPGADELFVFPTVFENVPKYAPDQRNVGARTKTDELIGVRGSACETRIADDERCVILFLRLKHM